MEKYQRELIKNLKKYRNAGNLSQAQLAELCNVATGTIGNIECGVAKPSFDLLITLAEVLGTTPASLLSADAESDDAPKSSDHTVLLEIFAKLKAHLGEQIQGEFN